MSVHLVGSAIVRTTPGVGSWTVWAVEQSGGVASAHRRHGLTEVVVADAPSSADSSTGFTAVACTTDGSAMVLCPDAPPALLVTPTGCRTAPQGPGGRELVAVGDDELLILLSSSVLETRPALLSQLLQSPADLVGCDPARLLGDLFSEVSHGAGAVLSPRTRIPTESEEFPA